MNDSDPRPMPPEVQRAYRDPLELANLLASHAYRNEDRLEIRDRLLNELVRRFGEVEVFVGDKGKTQKVSSRVRSFKTNWVAAIEFMLDVEGFGGKETTLPILARLMEPRWQAWWETFKQRESIPSRGVHWTWSEVAVWVLGERQIRWVAAQLARERLPFATQADVEVVLPEIETVEAYCVRPTDRANERMLEEHEALGGYLVRLVTAYEDARQALPYEGRSSAYKQQQNRERLVENTLCASGPSAITTMIPGPWSRHERPFNWMRNDFRRFFTPTLLTEVG